MNRAAVALLLGTSALLGGCGGSATKPPASGAASISLDSGARSVPMMKLPARPASRCRSTPLRPACPRLIPRVPYKLVNGQVAGGVLHGFVVSGPRHVNGFWVFDLQHGVPHDRSLRGNRPPSVFHMTIYEGDLSQALGGMAYPKTRRNTKLRNDIVAATRKPLLFGPVTWAGRTGALFLAPSYPTGGEIGGHLAFWWQAHGDNYLVSIHAWTPLTQCEKALHAVVASTPMQ